MKPILFNQQMIKAILDNKKHCTRRVVKARINNELCDVSHCISTEISTNKDGNCVNFYDKNGFYAGAAKPPYQVGDIIYVRETWRICPSGIFCYKAIGDCDTCSTTGENTFNVKWRPSIHMSKEAARIFLKVTDVRVERVQDITEEDARKEGFNSKEEFIKTFLEIYPDCTEESYLWVIEFERCEKP